MKANKLVLLLFLAIVLLVALVLYCTGGVGDGNSHTVQSALVLSEVMASNKGSVPDENGDYPDWIELYNSGSAELDVAASA